jgi:hypothetical protein
MWKLSRLLDDGGREVGWWVAMTSKSVDPARLRHLSKHNYTPRPILEPFRANDTKFRLISLLGLSAA